MSRRAAEGAVQRAAGRGLGPWWLLGATVALALTFVAFDHVLRAALVLAAGLVVAAILRIGLPEARGEGLRVRARGTDVVLYLGAAVNVLLAALLVFDRAPLGLLFVVDATLGVLLVVTLVRESHVTRGDVGTR